MKSLSPVTVSIPEANEFVIIPILLVVPTTVLFTRVPAPVTRPRPPAAIPPLSNPSFGS